MNSLINIIATINDVKPPVESSSSNFWWWVAALSFIPEAILLAWAGYAFIKRRKQKQLDAARLAAAALLPPYEQALSGLEDAHKLIGPKKEKELSISLSDVIRRYLEREYVLPAPERTTEEFLRDVNTKNLFSGNALPLLTEFLRLCDLAKFAKHAFSEQEQHSLFQKAKDFLELAHQQKHPIHTKASVEKKS